MPLYDFRCKNCDETYQEWATYLRRDEVACPHCHSKEKEQLFKANIKGPAVQSCGPSGSGFS